MGNPTVPPKISKSDKALPLAERTCSMNNPEGPPPPSESDQSFNPASLTPEDIQAFVARAVYGVSWRKYKINPPPIGRPIRVYADGVYDLFHIGHALQLRQAKLSFFSVYLLAGVHSDEEVRRYKDEYGRKAVGHCAWVDEVVPYAPWIITQDFIDKHQIDYVAHDEDPYPTSGHADAYEYVKSQGKFIPTRRTPGVSTSDLLARIVDGYRKCELDARLEKIGLAELRAGGSEFEKKKSREHWPA